MDDKRICLKVQRLWVQIWPPAFLYGAYVLPLPVRVLPSYFGLFPNSKNMHGRFMEDSEVVCWCEYDCELFFIFVIGWPPFHCAPSVS